MNHRLVLLCVIALAGCSSQPGPLTQTEFCDKYAQEICAAVSPACLVTAASCTAGRLNDCSAVAQANATRDFIPPNAQVCLDKVRAAYGKLNQGAVALGAADIQTMNEACGDVYRGTGLANGPCLVDADCLDGLICDKGYCGTAKLVTQGAGCANIGEYCPRGFTCSDAGGFWMCGSKVGLGGACGDSLPCLENLRCSAGLCSVQLEIGADCTVDQDCSSGFCEPYAHKCAQDVRFANGSAACMAMGSS
jgi:hypothetical protein